MKRASLSILISFVSLSGWALAPATGKLTLDLAKAKTGVEFLAIGNPSALRIRGKAKEPAKSVQGSLTVQNGQVTGKVALQLDDLDTGMDLRNRHMKEKYLQTAQYPKAEVALKELKLPATAAGTDYMVKEVPFKGDLTLHGVTKPISGVVDIERHAGNFVFDFGYSLKTSDFKIETPTFMGITMADEVKVTVNVEGPATIEGPVL